MGDINQRIFIARHQQSLQGPYLEVGSKDYGTTEDLRSIFAARDKYIGVDQQGGPGVDVVLDLSADFEQIDAALCGVRFGTIFCLSVLEHCRQPFCTAENLTRLLRPGGKICISAPFAWRYHGYPDDYWRFTHQGIRQLFPRLDFDLTQSAAATSRPGELKPLNSQLGKIQFSWKWHRRQGHALRGISAKLLALGAKIGVMRWVAGYRYVLAPTNVLLIGTLKDV